MTEQTASPTHPGTPPDTENTGALCLPQSGLILSGNTLSHKRVTLDDQTLQPTTPLEQAPTTGSFDLKEVHEARIVRKWQPGALFSVIPLGALTVVAKLYIPWEGWAWAAAILLGTLALMPLGIARSRCLRIKTSSGPVVYPLLEAVEDCDGFVATLNQRLQKY